MPDVSLLFSVVNNLAVLPWLALVASLFWPRGRAPIWTATGLVVPAAVGALYAVLLPFGLAQAEGGGYMTIPQVRALFASDMGVTVGWFHYIAFDLFVGTWIARDGVSRGMPAWIMAPCLLIAFLFGPAGFLLFVLIRLAWAPGAGARV